MSIILLHRLQVMSVWLLSIFTHSRSNAMGWGCEEPFSFGLMRVGLMLTYLTVRSTLLTGFQLQKLYSTYFHGCSWSTCHYFPENVVFHVRRWHFHHLWLKVVHFDISSAIFGSGACLMASRQISLNVDAGVRFEVGGVRDLRLLGRWPSEAFSSEVRGVRDLRLLGRWPSEAFGSEVGGARLKQWCWWFWCSLLCLELFDVFYMCMFNVFWCACLYMFWCSCHYLKESFWCVLYLLPFLQLDFA